MAIPTVSFLGGSLRQRSISRAAMLTAAAMAQEHEVCVEVLDVRELNLPMFIPDRGIEEYLPEQQAGINRLVDVCRRSDAMVWSSPTYHGTVSGVFKNAIDFIELLSKDSRPYLQGCAVGLIAINDNTPFTAMAHMAHELRAWLAPTQVTMTRVAFSDDLVCMDERVKKRLNRLVNELLAFVER